MKKALLVLLIIVCLGFLVANQGIIVEFIDTVQGGALIPLIVAVILMLARHIVQALSYQAAFEAVNFKTTLWHNIVLIFNLVFINTFCLFSGATGVAFIIDDAHRQGADIGTATSGAVLSQIGYFAAVFVISCIGFVAMWLSGMLNWIFVTGGLLLAGTLLVLASFFMFGYFKPGWLEKIFGVVDRIARKFLKNFKRELPQGWGHSIAHSFIRSAHILAQNPKGAAITVLYAAASAILNMFCLVAIGYAFGFQGLGALVAAFSLAAISVILSPTPQGVGVVEAGNSCCSHRRWLFTIGCYRYCISVSRHYVLDSLLYRSGVAEPGRVFQEQKRRKQTCQVSRCRVDWRHTRHCVRSCELSDGICAQSVRLVQ